MESQPRKLSGQYHLTGADIVESIDDLGSDGRWEELQRHAHQPTAEMPQGDTSTSFTANKVPDRSQSFRPYEGKASMGTEQSEDIHPPE
ncbi:uncharacterized protein BP01DRAFT_379740 [Aspergillus saccharolyticus JOP 1030-1]|uniref:Uncharacterized protein n=1 Tax=Aspergillus saccharolyticus JOP 1030-1 TaxID=1450539 RepID=A0A318ZLU3_9EURO|nr:hypothetical protein BP01DRAFT_379740 [Aspergillus saccharolyticus JOP 1030-1]PYH48559.1 hypothetical protein BP01DRAFT_379740 [Aspergillus saccharolyticus JOP 1030-1]